MTRPALALAPLLVAVLFAPSSRAQTAPAAEPAPAAPPAPAPVDEETCRRHYERAQELRVAERPLAARAELALCVQSCSEAPREDCVRWQAEVAGEIPRLLVVVVDAEGRLVQPAAVTIDGRPLSVSASSSAVELEAGTHQLRARAHAGDAEASAEVSLSRGAVQQVRLQLGPRRAAPAPASPTSSGAGDHGAALWGVGGLGLAAGLAGAALIVAGHVKNADDEETCAARVQMPGNRPGCTRAEADDLELGTERLWIAGGITGGAGLALMTAAALGLALRAPRPAASGISVEASIAGQPGLSVRGRW